MVFEGKVHPVPAPGRKNDWQKSLYRVQKHDFTFNVGLKQTLTDALGIIITICKGGGSVRVIDVELNYVFIYCL